MLQIAVSTHDTLPYNILLRRYTTPAGTAVPSNVYGFHIFFPAKTDITVFSLRFPLADPVTWFVYGSVTTRKRVAAPIVERTTKICRLSPTALCHRPCTNRATILLWRSVVSPNWMSTNIYIYPTTRQHFRPETPAELDHRIALSPLRSFNY